MTQPKHTHPLGYVDHTAKQLKDYWFLIILVVWQWASLSPLLRTGAVLVVLVWLLIWPLLQWFSVTYLITPTAIVVHSGIFVRHHRHIPYARLQTVQRKQWFYLRPFHLETLQIETASHQDGEPEVKLRAVPTTVADTIEDYRQAVQLGPQSAPTTAAAEPVPATPSETVAVPDGPVEHSYVIDHHALSLFALTSTGVIPLLVALLWLYGKLPHKLTDSLIDDAAHFALPLIVGGVVLVLLVAWIIAYLWVLIRYYRFTLTSTSDHLQIAKGFFQRNTISAPLDRVQAVRCKQNILRQWLHIQTIQVLLASKAATGDNDHDLVILPAIDQRALYPTLHPFIDWVPASAPTLTDLKVTPWGRWLLCRNAVLFVALPVLLLCLFLRPWGLLSLLLLPIAILQGLFAGHNTGGTRLNDQLLVLQTGHFWTRETFFVPRDQIQSMKLTWSVWLPKHNLAHLAVNVRHGNHNQEIELRYIPADQAQALYAWYLASAR